MAVVSLSFHAKGYSLFPGLRKAPGFWREFTFQHKTTKYGHLLPNSMKKKNQQRQSFGFFIKNNKKTNLQQKYILGFRGHLASGDM